MGEFIYDWKKAGLSLLVLLLGSFCIISINSSNQKAIDINWDGIYLFLVPIITFICFFPILVIKIITKIRKKTNPLIYK
jgi:hypothetical protein